MSKGMEWEKTEESLGDVSPDWLKSGVYQFRRVLY